MQERTPGATAVRRAGPDGIRVKHFMAAGRMTAPHVHRADTILGMAAPIANIARLARSRQARELPHVARGHPRGNTKINLQLGFGKIAQAATTARAGTTALTAITVQLENTSLTTARAVATVAAPDNS